MILLLIEIIGSLYFIHGENYCYVGAIIVGVGVFSSNALILSWVTSNIGGQTRRAMALAMISAFGNIGAILSEMIYVDSNKKVCSDKQHYIIIGILCMTFILVFLLKLLLQYENKRQKNGMIPPAFHQTTTADEIQPLLHQVNILIK